MKYLFSAFAVIAGILAFSAQRHEAPAPTELTWYTFEQAVELNQKAPRKMMIDVYTHWCGWCKRMDKGAFADPKVVEYVQANFYPVKLNAEQREDILFGRDTFRYVDTGNGRGVNTLAYSLLDGQLGYPTIVYLDGQYRRIMISPGFKESADLLLELKFAAEEHYNTTTWEDFKSQNGN